MRIALYRAIAGEHRIVAEVIAGADGRSAGPLLDGFALTPGHYRLVFAAGEFFRARGVGLAEPPFVEDVVIDFGIADANAHYHVPLLVSPWSYATYRGS